MPFEVDTEALDKAKVLDISKPPLRQIPHLEYPKVIYLWPKEPFKLVRVKNDRGEVVEEYKEATTHKAMKVENKEEMEKQLSKGWRKEPYLPKEVPDDDYPVYEELEPSHTRKKA